MASIYVDTSALGRVLLAEPDAKVIDAALSSYEARWSSSLLAVELGRLGKAESLEAEAAEQLKTVVLLPVTEARLVLLLALLGGSVGVGMGALATVIYAHAKHWAVVVPTEAWAGRITSAIADERRVRARSNQRKRPRA